MVLRDRALADIGVCRADLHAAISGMMPVEHLARTQGGARTHGDRRWMAPLRELRQRPVEAPPGTDLERRRLSSGGHTYGFSPVRSCRRSGTPGSSNAARKLLVR
jgi:hypothetical protein